MINILVISVDLKQYQFTSVSYNPFILNDVESLGHIDGHLLLKHI